MNWIELRAVFDKAPDDWSPVIDLLGNLGCPNTLQEDRPPAITACLVNVEGATERAERVKSALREAGATDVFSRIVPDEDWMEAWKKFFKPRRVGRHFVIRPTWESASHEPDDHVIVLDPGQAFGTGDHPTTRLCMELLEEIDLRGKRVADVGCGSGILSIAACQLGAAEVRGVDIEPLSVEVAKANAELNGVAASFVAGDSISVLGAGTWDVVVSNIISATLVAMAHEISEAVRSAWIVSGIIEANWPDVEAAAKRVGFKTETVRHEDGWVAARFSR